MTNSPAPRQDTTPTWLYAMLMIGGLVVAVAFTSVIWIRFEKMNQPRIPAASTSTGLPNWIPQTKTQDQYEAEITEEQERMRKALDPNYGLESPSIATSGTLEVVWRSPREISSDRFLEALPENSSGTKIKIEDLFVNDDEQGYDYIHFESLYERGTVSGGEYSGWSLIELTYIEEGLGSFSGYHYFIVSPQKDQLIVLGGLYNSSGFTIAPNLSVKLPDFPPSIALPNGKRLYTATARYGNGPLSHPSPKECGGEPCSDEKVVARTSDGTPLYSTELLSNSRTVSMLLPSGERVGYYSYILPKTERKDNYELNVLKEDIAWSISGIPDEARYYTQSFEGSGCGGRSVINLVNPGPMSSLISVGKTAAGEDIYAPKDFLTHPMTSSTYELWYQYGSSGEKPDVNTFLKELVVPYFFWKDAFGRWVMYQSDKAIVLAECGKPVIYLYPEKTTSVSVRLPSFINVTVSEPTYPKQGWTALAHPDGTLVMPDGSKYGSLFWEGTGVAYKTPTEGWLVKDGEQETFLRETLAKLGLNQNESKEFMEFWLPLMQDAPYYRVSFIVSEWSKAAPLYVSPKPTTQIRVFMDWEKRSSPISIKAPQIETPKREGFTLVEWGGLLRK